MKNKRWTIFKALYLSILFLSVLFIFYFLFLFILSYLILYNLILFYLGGNARPFHGENTIFEGKSVSRLKIYCGVR